MLHWTHDISGTRNMVVYACHILIGWCAKMGAIVIQVQATTMVMLYVIRRVHASRRWYEGKWCFSMLKVNSGP